MSSRMGIAIASGLLAVSALTGNADAEMVAPAQKAAPPKPQRFAGACAFKGTPDFCVMINVQGKLFNVSGANPALPIGRPVTGYGNVTTKFSPCGGVVLDVVTWKNVSGRCPTPKAKK